MPLNINGPINIITVKSGEGVILTLIADYHESCDKQTECQSVLNIDLAQYLAYIFDNYSRDEKLHFFIETVPLNHSSKRSNIRGRYADSVINMLLKSFGKESNFDGIVNSSDQFPNIMLHFADIRNIVYPNMDTLFKNICALQEKMNLSPNANIIEQIKSTIIRINSLMTFSYEAMFGTDFDDTDKKRDDNIELIRDGIRTILKKISNSYKSDKVKRIMSNYINTQYRGKFQALFINYDMLLKTLSALKLNIDKNGIDELNKLLDSYNSIWYVEITSKLMDFYLIRKLMNNPIKYAITYTGIEHTAFLVHILVKMFDFTIIKVSNINNITIEGLNSVAKSSSAKFVRNYLFPNPPIQCSSSDGFYNF